MYLLDLIFRLPPKTSVRIKFTGNTKTFCFTTGNRTTADGISKMRLEKVPIDTAKIESIYPLWHTEELYVECS